MSAMVYGAGAAEGAAITAPDALQRWADAIGGRAAIESVTVVHSVYSVEAAGLKGTAESIETSEGKRREALNLQDLYKTLTVFDGQNAWIRDHNGKVRQLLGIELQGEMKSAYLASFSQFVPGRRTGQVEVVSEDSLYVALKLMPDGGKQVTTYLDKQTFLPTRFEEQQGDRILTVYVEEWRDVGGLKWPSQLRQSTGDPQYDVRMTLEDVRTNEPVEPTAFAKPEEAAKDYRFMSGQAALDIPIELNSNHIFVQAQVNGQGPLWFILDTGAGVTVLNADKAAALGLSMEGKFEGRGAGEGSTEVSVVKDASFTLQGVELIGQTIMAIPLTKLEPYEGRHIDGILGYDLISRFVMKVDYENKLLSLYEPGAYGCQGDGARIPIVLEDSQPQIDAELTMPGKPPVKGHFTIDTGSRTALHLSKPFCEEHKLADATRTIDGGYGAGVGGETKQAMGRVASIKLGKHELKQIVAGFSQDEKGAMASKDNDGLIGGDILRRFTVIFDYSRLEMILESNASLAEPFEYDMCGMFLTAVAPDFNTFRVQRVVPNSPASEAGLQEGDVITAIDGRSSAEFSLEDVRKLFRLDGESHVANIKRGSESLSVNLKLRRLI
jgi:hypothetical protein